ncbi:MAG: FAD-dependent oxidoreductase [Candidatus Rokubacteria bacterium]|nr:FAD-dependent oxidoreductase [Candidatus Rokubacteria bacterium]
MTDRFDIVAVGAGLGGLCAAALLAAREGRRILVLERASQLGGRATSFVGQELASWDDYARPLGVAGRTRVHRAIPDADTIVREHRLDGYVFETGIHGIFPWGRITHILNAIGKPVPLAPNDAAAFYSGGRFHRVRRGERFPWMNERDHRDTKTLVREMLRMDAREIDDLDHVPFGVWLRERTDSERAIEFHNVMAGINLTLTDLAKMSTGDNIRINRQCVFAGYNMANGGTGALGEPGYRMVFDRLAEAIRAAGGEVRTNSRVTEILVRGRQVTGVAVQGPTGTYEVRAPAVVSNVPIQNTFTLLPETLFPAEWVQRVRGFWSAGGLCVTYGMRRPLLREAAYVPKLLTAADAGTDADLFYVYWPSSAWAPTRAPLGEQLVEGYVPLTEAETRDQGVLDRVCDAILAFMRAEYPGFDRDLKWVVFPVTNFLCGVAPSPHQVGEAKPEIASPHVDGLYFTGDTVKGWGCAADAAVHAALLCASAVGTQDYLQVVPSFMR